MPKLVSIIIPTFNSASELGATILALGEGLESGLVVEIVVSDGRSQDGTAEIASDMAALVVTGAAGRGGQLGRAARVAQGDWLLFLHADTQLAPGWARVVQDHIGREAKAAYFRLEFRAEGFAPKIVAGWANLRAGFGLPYGDQGLLISRELYRHCGGYQDIALMEDVAIVRVLRGNIIALPIVAATGAGRYVRGGWFWQGARNMWTLARYFYGADPDKLAQGYRR